MRFYPKKSYLIKIILLLPALLFFSCSIWGDFTTYFNLYYNTSNIFNDAEESIKEQNPDIFNTDDIIVPGSAKQQLVKVVEKASVILQFHSESAYVDNALLMLGKAFYYQKNYEKALRKFQELIATRSNSSKILETQLWIGKTELRLKNYDKALADLEQVRKKALDERDDDIIKDAYIEEIAYQISKKDYPAAINLSKEFLNVSDDDEINAEVVFETGKLYTDLNDPANAVQSFQKVFDYSPSYETEFNAKIELGKALRDNKQDEKALEIFNDLRNEDKYADSYDKIDLEIGLTELDLNNLNEAKKYLVAVDTSYGNSASAGIAKYKLGELYENKYKNFDSASYYYNRAASSAAPPEYIIEASEKVRLFNKYKNLSQSLSNYYTQLNYIKNPESFVKDSIAYYSDTVKTDTQNIESSSNQEPVRELQGRGRYSEERTREFNNISQTNNTQSINNQIKKGNPPIRPVLPEDSVKSLIVKNSFDLGNLFFTEFDLPDSAYFYYKKILDDFPNSDYQARAMYALGSYYETINKYQKADSLYNLIYDNYKNENIVNAAASKINKPLIDFNYDPAKQLYVEAENQLNSKNYSESVNRFFNIYKNYPQSNLAPKALYASGWILENKLEKYDSAAVIYDTMFVKYPNSIYAQDISSKLNLYNQEQARIKKAREDSLRKIQKQISDSLAAADSASIKNLINQDSLKTLTPSDSLLLKKENQPQDTIPKERRDLINPKEERLKNNKIDSVKTLLR